ncbi:plastocyanin/azurin family copper-binding protein [Aestuariivirga sp. YIM B02566]|uniref:Copper resistance protein n=1 Tax=Taklimakanibacter albus TaxID=2800327 RepID=A0ACC5RBV4_9HYPH|nr:plastocyanin/azurin family copper-binding protein [Aestuariivirga sp. YIM B02566]MBK1870181.1 copper resistance protein [Aestuariivirga sp. YIM B02566]
MHLRMLVATAILSSAITGTAFAAAPAKIKVSLLGEGGAGMEIKLSQSTVKAGKIQFDVTNDAITESHEVVLVKLNSPDQAIPVVKEKHRIDEGKLKALGEVEGLKAGEHGKLVVTLRPGAYELLCNIKGHYEAGMHTVLVVK